MFNLHILCDYWCACLYVGVVHYMYATKCATEFNTSKSICIWVQPLKRKHNIYITWQLIIGTQRRQQNIAFIDTTHRLYVWYYFVSAYTRACTHTIHHYSPANTKSIEINLILYIFYAHWLFLINEFIGVTKLMHKKINMHLRRIVINLKDNIRSTISK